ncbi:MAG TPA: type II toxin-antitoxin system VapC family toxin [Candidatus Dormibacteraeota bacterium]|nr:type II toxin-antitoxin system VapC family toxin [Candidatus Dormibacteraeota bacterium]
MDKDRLFVDANVLLEIILSRKNEKLARNILEDNSNNLFISALTAHLVVHFGQLVVDLPILRSFLEDYTILSLNESDFEWAFTNMRNQDFEDALQLAVAIRNGCNTFITLDKDLATTYNNLPQIKTSLLN